MNMKRTTLAQITGAAESTPLEALLNRPHTGFDPDAYHVMQERDSQMIRDELLHGSSNSEFVYKFSIKGTTVTGISVVGARELASQYKGIKARIVASTEKRGGLFIFRTFEPLGIETRTINELENDPDYYEVVMEITDIKSGNSIQVRKAESKVEMGRNGAYERPHYSVIAESKAFRNGVLAILPQRVLAEFKAKCLSGGQGSDELTIDQLKERTQNFCAKNGIAIVRGALNDLTYAELRGLASSASSIETFKVSAANLGIMQAPVAVAPEAQHNPAQLEAIAAIKSATTKADIARALSSLKPKDKDAVRPIAEERQAEIAAPATPDPETGEIVTDGEWLAGFDGQPAQ